MAQIRGGCHKFQWRGGAAAGVGAAAGGKLDEEVGRGGGAIRGLLRIEGLVRAHYEQSRASCERDLVMGLANAREALSNCCQP